MNDDKVLPMREPVGAFGQCQMNFYLHILVVDDERAALRLITTALAGSGYRVDAAENGDVAWKALQSKRYDLLITDNSMPIVTGVELVKKVRGARIALPVIMATGALPNHELTQNPPLELAATFLKPFPIAVLLDTVRAVLGAAPPSACNFL
jgi:DNA-binding response OmpR family regulator